MHDSSHEKMARFVDVHLDAHRGTPLSILDFGSQVVDEQGLSYKGLFDDPAWTYRGLDIAAGANVDICVENAYDWGEVSGDSIDLVISGQAFEHVEYFWASMFEIMRVLRPGGLATIIAPSSGFEHRYPLDCWRFYRDGFEALARHVGADVIDSFTDWGNLDWEDSILVARKPMWDQNTAAAFHRRSVLQRALLTAEPVLSDVMNHWDDVPTLATEIEPSPLHSVTPGLLTADLEAARDRRRAEQSRAAAEARAADEALHAELATLRQLVADGAGQPSAARQLYGQTRARVAQAVGPRGRAAYKRLRGRA